MVNDTWHEGQTPETVGSMLDDLKARGESALTGCYHAIEHSTTAAARGEQ
jgi:hypothetical protein